MEYIKHILFILLLLLSFSSCEFNPIRFGWTDYSVDERFYDSQEYNKTHPPHCPIVNSDEYTFTATSDYHLDADSAFLPKFFKYINNSESKFIFLNGDLYNGKKEYADFTYSALKNGIKKPAYYIAGNHDQYFGWKTYYKYWGSSTYSFTVKTPNYEDLYIVLETGSSTLGISQFDWLKNTLTNRDKYRYCIIITHSNFTIQEIFNGVFMQEEAVVLFDLFYNNNVNMVISGHSHIENDVTIENVRYITTGAIKNGEFGTCIIKNSGIDFRFEKLK